MSPLQDDVLKEWRLSSFLILSVLLSVVVLGSFKASIITEHTAEERKKIRRYVNYFSTSDVHEQDYCTSLYARKLRT